MGGDLGVDSPLPGPAPTRPHRLLQRYEDLVDFDFETFPHVNRSQVEAPGAEMALRLAAGRRPTVEPNGTWQQVEDARDRSRPPTPPPGWAGGVPAGWRPVDRLDLSSTPSDPPSFDEQIPVPERARSLATPSPGLRRLPPGPPLAAPGARGQSDRPPYETLDRLPRPRPLGTPRPALGSRRAAMKRYWR